MENKVPLNIPPLKTSPKAPNEESLMKNLYFSNGWPYLKANNLSNPANTDNLNELSHKTSPTSASSLNLTIYFYLIFFKENILFMKNTLNLMLAFL